MAKQTLPTNFKDDILSSSMGGKRKYLLIDNGDGTYSLEDVTEYTQTGSDFGAGQINATNQAVNESCDKADVIDDLEDVVANQASGMIAGAKAVAELNGKFEWTSYPQSSISIATFYIVRDFDLRKRDNEVFLNVSLSISTSTQWDPNTLYTVLSSPLPAELRPRKEMSYYLNGFGCDNNWGATTPMTAFVESDGYIKYTAPSKSANFKISGHWFVG